MKLRLLLLVLAIFDSVAIAISPGAGQTCLGELRRLGDPYGYFHVHAYSSNRPSAEVLAVASSTAAFSPFDYSRVLSGEVSVLSLGEGTSNFVETILRERKRRQLPILDVHAVDVAFASPELLAANILNPSRLTEHVDRVERVKAEFPENFHGVKFHEMDIRDNQGQRVRFKEIISSYALGYALRSSSPDARLKIMRIIADHAQPGATLRMWVELLAPLAGRPENFSHISDLVAWKESGLIKDYQIAGEVSQDGRREITVITFP